MPRWLYSLLLRIALPAAMLAFLWRGWRSSAYRGRLHERLGWNLQTRSDRPLWLHAASVGEVRAMAVLVRALHSESLPLLITAGTPTGLARARELFADQCKPDAAGHVAVTVQAAPWDLPGAVRRFLRATRPRLAVFLETELWPNLVAGTRDAGISLALLSARLSERSLRRYRGYAARLMRDTVRTFAVIGTQSERDRERFIELGADAATVTRIGNLKFDLPVEASRVARGNELRERWARGRALWVAGSTHPGEEAQCIAAHLKLQHQAVAAGRIPPLLALAPRRPERFTAVASWLARDLRMARSSQHAAPAMDTDVVLVDQMGVLTDWYAAADVAFVGGSLVPVGGHNLLEPAALGRPVVAGPHGFNAPEVMQQLLEAGGLVIVADADQLAAAVAGLLEDGSLAIAQGARAAGAVAANRGAAERAHAIIRTLLRAAPTAPVAAPGSD